MITTNNFNLPEPMVRALTSERRKPVLGRLSATALIDSPLRRILSLKHFEELTEDVSDNLWLLLGTAVHHVIEKSGHKDESEVKTVIDHDSGATLVMVMDYYKDGELIDWKVTSVYSFLLGTKIEWVNQMNVMKYILNTNNIPVNNMRIYAILRDWVKTKSYDPDYPKIPFKEAIIESLPEKELEEYINQRVHLHLEAEKHLDDVTLIPQCSEEERWTRPTVYAVTRKGIKKSIRNLESMEEAKKYISGNASLAADKNIFVDVRKGIDMRCEQYCGVSQFCPYYKPGKTE